MNTNAKREPTPLMGVLEGTVSVLLAIKKNHPDVAEPVTLAIRNVAAVIAQQNYRLATEELKGLAQNLHNQWQNDSKHQKTEYLRTAARLESLPLEHFSRKQRDAFNNFLTCLRNGCSCPVELRTGLSLVLSDFSETIETLHKASFEDKEVEVGAYTKGVDSIKKADLAAVTVRMTNDLKRLMDQLNILHPGESRVVELNDRIKKLDKKKIHFFEMIDMLSECAWLVYRMNDLSIASQRDYLLKLVEQVTDFANKDNEVGKLVDSSQDELNEFSIVLSEEFSRIKSEAHDSTSVSDLKQILNQKMELLQNRLAQHVSTQSRIISEQKAQILTQNNSIKKLQEAGASYKRELKEASKNSLIDHLTGIANRRAFDIEMNKLSRKWSDGEIDRLAVTIFDVDHFKSVNDTHGHHIGDMALRFVSDRMRSCCKDQDGAFFARYGGEEFALILFGSNPKEMLISAKSLKDRVSSNPFKVKNIELNITVSAGVCFFSETAPTIERVIIGADKALYKAKESGRNKVWVANKVF